MKNDETGANLITGVLGMLAMIAFLVTLVLMAYITLTVSIVFGAVLLAGMGGLMFGPAAFKPYILVGMIFTLCVMVIAVAR
jgi:hypothetical protein